MFALATSKFQVPSIQSHLNVTSLCVRFFLLKWIFTQAQSNCMSFTKFSVQSALSFSLYWKYLRKPKRRKWIKMKKKKKKKKMNQMFGTFSWFCCWHFCRWLDSWMDGWIAGWLVDWLNRGVGIWQCHANLSCLTNSNALHLLYTTCLI